MYTVFDPKASQSTLKKMFLDPDGGVSIARFDRQKYPQFEKLVEKQIGFGWRPEEVDIQRDRADFRKLDEAGQHAFTANLGRQILIDSVTARATVVALLPLVSLPELENWIQEWAHSETIHTRSYTHIIRGVYTDPAAFFDQITQIPEILETAYDISHYFNDLINYSNLYQAFGEGQLDTAFYPTDRAGVEDRTIFISKYELKKKIWLAIQSINIMEGIRFYASFACSWAFAERKSMEGNAKIIKLICRDENLHLAGSQHMLKILIKDDPEFADIAVELREEVREMWSKALASEKAWSEYLFSKGSMIGLNHQFLCQFLEHRTYKLMKAIGLEPICDNVPNSLPWTNAYISGSSVQVAPQETEITSYIIGGIEADVNKDTFKGFTL